MKKLIKIFFALIFLLSNCNKTLKDHKKINVLVTIPPQIWFVKQIAGDNISVSVIVKQGKSPHVFEPTPKEILELSTSDLWILSGVEIEKSIIPRIKNLNPNLIIFDSTTDIKFRNIENHNHTGNEHSQGKDPHIWLGCESSIIMASNICNILVKIDPLHKKEYEKNFLQLKDMIHSLFKDLRKELSSFKGKKVFVYHPAFGYFLDEFGLIQRSIELEGKEPSPSYISSIIKEILEEKPVAIFLQKELSDSIVKVIAKETDTKIIILDPLSEDWFSNIKNMGETLKESLASSIRKGHDSQ